jgi:hypothetical protein
MSEVIHVYFQDTGKGCPTSPQAGRRRSIRAVVYTGTRFGTLDRPDTSGI